jgi:cyclase
LLLKDLALVKSVRFKNHKYIGDPINAVRIFNELRADELVFLDIDATRESRLISLEFVKDVGEEARMPFCVGGGIRTLYDIRNIIAAGAEKVVVSTQAALDPEFVRRAADEFGSSTIVVCMDVKRRLFRGELVWSHGGTKPTQYSPVEFAQMMERNGAGELIVQSIERDGVMNGYDLCLISSVASAVGIPVIALGGAGRKSDLIEAFTRANASALGVGSLCVYQGEKRGVLINYPERELNWYA